MVISHLERQADVWPALLRLLAMLALAAGVGVWGALLLAPRPALPPPLLSASASAGADMGAVVRWFGAADLRIKLTVTGVMAADNGFGAALLSINGAPARAFKSGETIAEGVILESVSAAHIVINQDGRAEQVDFVRQPGAHVNGFIAVP